MREIRGRFNGFLTVCQSAHGEERFESRPPSQESSDLVEESLNRFTPWTTSCSPRVAPLDADPRANDDENRIEANRMHTILHPDCFRRIAATLGLDPPGNRLEIPVFTPAGREKDETGPPADRRHPPELTALDLEIADRHVAEETARRRRASAGLLRVLVDGTERAQLDLKTVSKARIPVEGGAELVEVKASEPEGDVLLAVHLLQHDWRVLTRAVVFEEGHKIAFSIAPGESGSVVEIAYRQPGLTQILSNAIKRTFFGAGSYPSFRPALGLVVIVLSVVSLGLFVASRLRRPGVPPIEARANPTPVPPAQISRSQTEIQASGRGSETTAIPAGPPRRVRHAQTKEPGERFADGTSRESGESPQLENETEGEGTRAMRAAPAAVSLRDVHSVYVDVSRGDPSSLRLRDRIIHELRMTHRLTVAEGPEQADAVLKASWDTSRGAAARLINISGRVIWPAARKRRLAFHGPLEESAAALIGDMLKAIESPELKK